MSNKIKILDSELTELATISVASSAVRSEKINSDNTLNFSVRVKSGYGDYITDISVFELDGDYFDVAYYKKEQQGDGRLMISVEAEHVSYRLNAAEYDVEYFTETDTPMAILAAILDGTGFTVGAVDFSAVTTFSLQQAASRRGLLMQFAAYMGGELEFDGFDISLLEQRGSATPKALTVGKDLTVVSKAVDKRHLDTLGNPTVSYTCGVYKGAALNLGDVVTLDYDALDIDVSLRVVSKAYDPYNPNSVTVEIGNYVNSLEDDLYRIETQAIKKDALMNGTRIGPEYGFEAVRNDKLARAFFRSDGFKMQSGDGEGNWTDKIYFDPVEGTYIFDGKLSADAISAIVVDTPNLYAEKATISELTVDQLDTSTKVQKFLSNDTSDVNYIRARGQTIQFVTASVAGTYGASRLSSGTWDMSANDQTGTYYSGVSIDDSTGAITYSGGASMTAWDAYYSGRVYRSKDSDSFYVLTGAASAYVYYDVYDVTEISVNYEQAKNRKGELLYWTDSTHTSASADETIYPVYVYLYNEAVKMEQSFFYDGEYYVPSITLGAGSGSGNNGKSFIYKSTDGLCFDYYGSTDGALKRISLTDGGVFLSPYSLESIDFYNDGFTAEYNATTAGYRWTKDGLGRIIQLTDIYTSEVIPVTWNAGDM